VSEILIGFVLGLSTASLVLSWAARRYIRNKVAFRQLIADMYHRDLLPEICRAEGLVDLARREHHHLYAELALKEIRAHKEKVLKIIKKYEPFQEW
jgi:hypothetical protein